MTNHDEDLDGGGKPPSKQQVVRISAHLQSKNLGWGARPTHRELEARNFSVSIATVQRILKQAGIEPPHDAKSGNHLPGTDAKNRVDNARENNRRDTQPKPKVLGFDKEDVIPPEGTVRAMADLIIANKSSAELAIEENRARMALNIVIAEMMAAKKELLLLDMRGTAALVDALTCAAKLSGGAALDIRYPTDAEKMAAAQGLSPNGHEMKDITPAKPSLLDEYRRMKASNGNGAGA